MEEIPITQQNNVSITEEMKNELRKKLLSYIDDTYEWNEKMAHRITSIVMIFYEYNDLRMKLLYNQYDLNLYLLELKVKFNKMQTYFNNQLHDKEEMYLIDSVLELNEITEEMRLKLKEELIEMIDSLFKDEQPITEQICEKLSEKIIEKYGYQYLKLKLMLKLITSEFFTEYIESDFFDYILSKDKFVKNRIRKIVDEIMIEKNYFNLWDFIENDHDELDSIIEEITSYKDYGRGYGRYRNNY